MILDRNWSQNTKKLTYFQNFASKRIAIILGVSEMDSWVDFTDKKARWSDLQRRERQ